MSYTHLTTFERGRLEALHHLGWSARAIANELKRHHSTISRELQRNSREMATAYSCEDAQNKYVDRRKSCVPKGKWSPYLAKVIEDKLKLTWSPEQIVGRLKDIHLSFKSIYRWLYQGLLTNVSASVLRHKGKRQKPVEKRGRFNIGTSIRQRPKEVKERHSFGHWELDTMVSSRGKSKGCLATFAERKTRIYYAIKMEDDLNLPIYFADPYSSWQRGTNENANGLVREFFPKKTDLAQITNEELNYALFLINNRPRKCLNWRTSHEVFWDEVSQLD